MVVTLFYKSDEDIGINKVALVFGNPGHLSEGGIDYDYIACYDLIKDGWNVQLCTCNMALPCCRVNPIGESLTCFECCFQHFNANYQNPKIKRINLGKPKVNWFSIYNNLINNFNVSSEKDLQKIYYLNMDIGFAILSNAYNYTLGDTIDIKKDIASLEKSIKSVLFAYLAAVELIKDLKPGIIVLWNSRMAETRAFLRAAESSGIPFVVTEMGSDRFKWHKYYNTTPFDKRYRHIDVFNFWKSSNPDLARIQSIEWFKSRRMASLKKQQNFNINQKRGLVSSLIPNGKKVISIFTTTWREFVALDDNWNLPFGLTQVDATKQLLDQIRPLKDDYHIIIRLHPNQVNAPIEVDKFKLFQNEYVSILGPEDPTDSYALIDLSDVVITFGSTVGIEATFWRKASILCAPSFYDSMEVSQYCTKPNDVVEFILNKRVFPWENTLPYGYYYANFGVDKCISFRRFLFIKRFFNIARCLKNVLRFFYHSIRKF